MWTEEIFDPKQLLLYNTSIENKLKLCLKML